jgi:cobalt-zinc-cadmium resistance protein CzcA
VARYLEKRLKAFPEVEAVVSKTGRAEISEDPMGPEQTDVFVMLKGREAFDGARSRAELAVAMQRDLSQIPGLRFSFSQPIALRVNELISGVKSDLAVKVFGSDLALLKGFADRMAVAVSGVAGATDVKVEQVSGLAQYDVVVDREAAARHGIAVGDVNDTIESAIAGKRATTVIEDQRRVALVVRFPPESRSDAELRTRAPSR